MTDGAHVLRGQGRRPLVLHVAGLGLLLLGIPQLLFTALMVSEALAGGQGITFGALGMEGLTPTALLAVSPVLILSAGAQVALGYGVLRHRWWARPVGAFLWFGLGVLVAGVQLMNGLGAVAASSLLTGLVLSGIACAYLYANEDVGRYYRTLEAGS